MQHFLRAVAGLQKSIVQAQKAGITLAEAPSGDFGDFKASQRDAHRNAVLTGIAAVQKLAQHVQDERILSLVNGLSGAQDLGVLKETTDRIIELGADQPEERSSIAQPPNVPADIADEVLADYREMLQCLNSGSYRSAVILCGRILETVLHRKYYEVTGNDLLEKSPGIGLGSLVSKLAEKDVVVDPALGNQIHLINQVRVHSVHHKKQAFVPSKQQAHAIILYTLDVVSKFF